MVVAHKLIVSSALFASSNLHGHAPKDENDLDFDGNKGRKETKKYQQSYLTTKRFFSDENSQRDKSEILGVRRV